MPVRKEIAQHKTLLTHWRRQLHQIPELAFEEHQTSTWIANELRTLGLEVHTGLAGTGVVASCRAGTSDRAIALRADMDALPIAENNTFAHRSQHPGKMHACGHDGHSAMLLGAAKVLSQTRNFEGQVHFVFQPAEEAAGGGKRMVEEGLFERFPCDSVYGLHNWPGLDVGKFAVKPGSMMAAFDTFEVTILGRGCHAAMPELGVDPIVIGAELVNALQTLVSRELGLHQRAVVSVTQFHAGDAWAVIPERAVLRGTTRSFEPEVRALLERRLKEVCQHIASAHNATVEVSYEQRYPPTLNDAAAAHFCARVAQKVFGANCVNTNPTPSAGAEDFAFMLQEKPGAYAWLGNGATAGGCVLHNPSYDFNDEALTLGVEYWVELVEQRLSPL